ncbi:MAG: alcohol dehydrogenase catalytic domain-containing protein [Parasporobacterium sp.]|nr:alcohol dehydrogenase catalytic domain-containing protein [Parasporobacterium sp.]
MKAVMYLEKGKVDVVEIEKPSCPPDEVMVRIEYYALCATDVHVVTHGLFGLSQPLTLGHEMSGTVVEIGPDVPEGLFAIGDHVTANPVPSCGVCPECRRGLPQHCKEAAFNPDNRPMNAMAEYRSYPVKQLFKVPADIPLKHVCLTEPITVASRGLSLADPQMGATICISGAGSVGLIMLDLIKYRGGTRVTVIDPVPEKRELALKMGASCVIDPMNQDVVEEGMKITDGLGYDVVFEMSGARSAAELCPALVAHGGCIEFFAVYPEDYNFPLNLFDMFNKEARIQFTFTDPKLYPRSIDLLKKLDMDMLVGPVYDIEDAPKAFEDFKRAVYPKLLIRCSK